MILKINKNFFFIKIIIILICFFFNINLINNIKFLLFFKKINDDISKIIKYLKLCNNQFKTLKIFKKYKIPIISIISPIYNRERYILRFLKSIQYQNFDNLEIIFIDDYSQDNSVNLIKELRKKDKRIKLIKNLINKGTFICRNLGVQFSLGNYIILPDPDDILSNNILNQCYIYAIRYNYEIIRFKRYKDKDINNNLKFYKDINLI